MKQFMFLVWSTESFNDSLENHSMLNALSLDLSLRGGLLFTIKKNTVQYMEIIRAGIKTQIIAT